MIDDSTTKSTMKDFYRSEAVDRDSEAWIALGGSARVPESAAAEYFIDRKVRTALGLAGLDPGSRVLEVGCSFGHMSFLLAQHFREVVAVDLSPESIHLARRRAEHYGVRNVDFREADAEALSEFHDGEFDGAFSFSTIRFCPNPDQAVRELHRVVRPGARVVIDNPNRSCPWYGPFKGLLGIQPHIHDRLYTAAETRALLRRNGFADIRSVHILFTTKRLPSGLLPLFKGLDLILEAIPGVRGLSGIIMAVGTQRGDG